MLAILEGTASQEDMKKCEKRYLEEMNAGAASNETRYNYANSILKCRPVFQHDLQRAIVLLEDLLTTSDREKQKDYLFDLAIANTRTAQYDRAEECIKKFMVMEPGNKQAHELYDIIHERIKKERLKDAAVAGGTAILIGGLFGLGMALASRR